MGIRIIKSRTYVYIDNESFSSDLNDHYPRQKYNNDVRYITKIKGKDLIEKEFGQLANDDIVLTYERKEHIKERRKEDYSFVINNIEQTINEYDYLLKDDSKKVIFVKKVINSEYNNYLVIYLSLKDESKANSIITGIKMNDDRVEKLIRNRKIIDKKM